MADLKIGGFTPEQLKKLEEDARKYFDEAVGKRPKGGFTWESARRVAIDAAEERRTLTQARLAGGAEPTYRVPPKFEAGPEGKAVLAKHLAKRREMGEYALATTELHEDYVSQPRKALEAEPSLARSKKNIEVLRRKRGIEVSAGRHPDIGVPGDPSTIHLEPEQARLRAEIRKGIHKVEVGKMGEIAKLEATGKDIYFVQLLDRKLSEQLGDRQTVYLRPSHYDKVKKEKFGEMLRYADPEEPITKRTLQRAAGRDVQATGTTQIKPGLQRLYTGQAGPGMEAVPKGITSRVREVAEIGLPEKVYGEGKMSPVKYVRITPGRTGRFQSVREGLYGNIDETLKSLSPDERTFLTSRAKLAKRFPQAHLKKLMTEFVTRHDVFAGSKAATREYSFMKQLFDSGRWKLPKKTLIALGAVGALGAMMMPREAEARGEGPLRTIATGAAAMAYRGRKEIIPGLKRLSADAFSSRKDYEEYLALEDAIGASRAKGKFGRDLFGSAFAAWVGEDWSRDLWGEFEPSIAGHVLGEIPLWLIGAKAMKTVFKGTTLGAKLIRSAGTGAISKAIPQTLQAIHGDVTVGEAMLSTAEEGAIWGAIDLVFRGVGGAAKYLTGIGRPTGVAATAADVATVQRSLLTKVMNFWPEKIGGPAWEGIVRQVKRIPGFEKAFVPSIRKLDVEARRSMEDTLAALDIGAKEARILQEKIFLGTTINEAAFITDVYRAVPSVGADGKNIVYDIVKKGMDPIAKEYGIGKERAAHLLHNYIQPVRRAFWGKGKEAVAQHMLTQEKFAEAVTYIPKKYRWHELNSYLKDRVQQPFLPMSRKLRVQLKNFMKRLPPEVTEKLEPINDLAYLTGKGLRDLTKDVELYKMYNALSKQKNSFAFASRKIGSGEIKEHFIKLKGDIEPRKVFVRNELWLKANNWVKLARKKVKGTKGMPEYGALSGGWVPKDLYESMTDMSRVAGPVERVFTRLLSKWKYGKVILRPATHVRNLMSNMILNDLGGLPFYKVHRYAQAARAMREKGANVYYREAAKTPLLALGGWAKYEVGTDRALKTLSRGGKAEKFYDMWYKARGRVQQAARVPSNMYDMEEKLFKMAKFIDNRKKGIAIREAYEDAMKWTFNYGEITPFVRGLRTWMMPFVTFSYKALPIVAESVVKHPMRFAKWPAMAMGVTWAALQKQEVTAQDWNYIKKAMPGYMRTGHFMLVPFRDDKGRLQMGDMTYIFPWGDIGELSQQGLLRILQNPAFTLASQLAQNQNFFGQPIWHNWESPQVKTFKVFNHIWRQMTPAWSPDLALGTNPELKGGFDWNNITRAVKQDTEDAPTMGQALSSTFGFKLKAMEPKREHRKRIKRKQWQQREAKSYYRRLIRDNPDRRKQLMLRKIEALREIREGDTGKFPGEWWRGKYLAGNPLAWTPTTGLKEK